MTNTLLTAPLLTDKIEIKIPEIMTHDRKWGMYNIL